MSDAVTRLKGHSTNGRMSLFLSRFAKLPKIKRNSSRQETVGHLEHVEHLPISQARNAGVQDAHLEHLEHLVLAESNPYQDRPRTNGCQPGIDVQ